MSFQNVEQVQNTEGERKVIYDLYCQSEVGEEFVIEMQKSKIIFFKDRGIYSLNFPIQRMARRGDWNYCLDPLYFLTILDFFYEPPSTAQLERIVQLKDDANVVFYDKLLLKYIQLPAFNKQPDELRSRKDQWFYFLKNLEDLSDVPKLFNDDNIFLKMLTIAEIAKLSPEEFQNYEVSRVQYLEIKGVADNSFQEGLQAAEDKFIPMLASIQNKAEKEQQRADQMTMLLIQTMHNNGETSEAIASVTQRTIDEVERVINQLK